MFELRRMEFFFYMWKYTEEHARLYCCISVETTFFLIVMKTENFTYPEKE